MPWSYSKEYYKSENLRKFEHFDTQLKERFSLSGLLSNPHWFGLIRKKLLFHLKNPLICLSPYMDQGKISIENLFNGSYSFDIDGQIQGSISK